MINNMMTYHTGLALATVLDKQIQEFFRDFQIPFPDQFKQHFTTSHYAFSSSYEKNFHITSTILSKMKFKDFKYSMKTMKPNSKIFKTQSGFQEFSRTWDHSVNTQQNGDKQYDNTLHGVKLVGGRLLHQFSLTLATVSVEHITPGQDSTTEVTAEHDSLVLLLVTLKASCMTKHRATHRASVHSYLLS